VTKLQDATFVSFFRRLWLSVKTGCAVTAVMLSPIGIALAQAYEARRCAPTPLRVKQTWVTISPDTDWVLEVEWLHIIDAHPSCDAQGKITTVYVAETYCSRGGVEQPRQYRVIDVATWPREQRQKAWTLYAEE
jgi:hypothetical protein